MGRKPDPFWQYVERLPDQGGFKCNFCEIAFNGGAGATRIKHHLAGGIPGIKGGIRSCENVPQNVKEEALAAIEIFKRNKIIGMVFQDMPSEEAIKRTSEHFMADD